MTKNNPLKFLVFLGVVLVIVASYFAFEKKEVAVPASPLDAHILLQKLPEHTAAFYSWRSDLPSYQLFKHTAALHGTDSFVNNVNKLPIDESTRRLLQTILTSIASSGLISQDPNTPDGLNEFLAFISGVTNQLDAGIYLTSLDTIDLKAFAASLKSNLESEHVSVTESVAEGKTLLTVTEGNVTMYALFDLHKGAIATTLPLVQGAFLPQTLPTYEAIVHNPRYQQLAKGHSSSVNQFGLGFVDVEAIPNLVSNMLPADAALSLASVPFGLVSLGQFADDTLKTEMLVELKPKNDPQKLLVANVSRTTENSLLERLPSTSAIFLIFDGQLIRTVEEGAVSDFTDDQKKMAQPWIETLSTIKGIALGALSVGRDSLVPDVYITAQSDRAEALFNFIKDQTLEMISTQIPMSNWLDKTVEDVPVKYIITPLGVGLYLTSIKDVFIAASTEAGITAVIKSVQGTLTSAKQPVATIDNTLTANHLISGYLDFRKIADAVESIQGSMSLFTGGASALNSEEVQDLKRLGTGTFGMSVQNSVLGFRWDLKPIHQ